MKPAGVGDEDDPQDGQRAYEEPELSGVHDEGRRPRLDDDAGPRPHRAHIVEEPERGDGPGRDQQRERAGVERGDSGRGSDRGDGGRHRGDGEASQARRPPPRAADPPDGESGAQGDATQQDGEGGGRQQGGRGGGDPVGHGGRPVSSVCGIGVTPEGHARPETFIS